MNFLRSSGEKRFRLRLGESARIEAERAEHLHNLFETICSEDGLDPPEFHDGRYLDVGCGSGDIAYKFRDGFKDIVVLDVRYENVSSARDHLGEKGLEISAVVGDARKLPFVDGSFSMVSGISLIEHLPNQEEYVLEMRRVLRKKGVFVLQMPNKYFPVDVHTGLPCPFLIPAPIMNSLLRVIYASDTWPGSNMPFILQYTSFRRIKKMMVKYFERVFSRPIIYPAGLIPRRWRSMYYVTWAMRFLNLVPLGYMIVGRK